jgi:hypothetical protein
VGVAAEVRSDRDARIDVKMPQIRDGAEAFDVTVIAAEHPACVGLFAVGAAEIPRVIFPCYDP